MSTPTFGTSYTDQVSAALQALDDYDAITRSDNTANLSHAQVHATLAIAAALAGTVESEPQVVSHDYGDYEDLRQRFLAEARASIQEIRPEGRSAARVAVVELVGRMLEIDADTADDLIGFSDNVTDTSTPTPEPYSTLDYEELKAGFLRAANRRINQSGTPLGAPYMWGIVDLVSDMLGITPTEARRAITNAGQ